MFAYVVPKGADGKPDRAAIEAVMPARERQIGILDRAVASTGHFVDGSFTFADINLLPILFYVRRFPEEAGGDGGGETACGLLPAARRAAELSKHHAAAATGHGRRGPRACTYKCVEQARFWRQSGHSIGAHDVVRFGWTLDRILSRTTFCTQRTLQSALTVEAEASLAMTCPGNALGHVLWAHALLRRSRDFVSP